MKPLVLFFPPSALACLKLSIRVVSNNKRLCCKTSFYLTLDKTYASLKQKGKHLKKKDEIEEQRNSKTYLFKKVLAIKAAFIGSKNNNLKINVFTKFVANKRYQLVGFRYNNKHCTEANKLTSPQCYHLLMITAFQPSVTKYVVNYS